MAAKRYSVILNKKIKEFNKVIEPDSDKSISIRAFLIGSISQGISKISNVLLSEDILSESPASIDSSIDATRYLIAGSSTSLLIDNDISVQLNPNQIL